jgi:hypothetical protein
MEICDVGIVNTNYEKRLKIKNLTIDFLTAYGLNHGCIRQISNREISYLFLCLLLS